MIKVSKSVLAVFCLLSACGPSADNDATKVAIADAYIDAYSAMDFDRMGSFYAEDAIFTDPTTLLYGAEGALIDIKGRDHIISMFKKYFEQLNGGGHRYETTEKYEAGGYVVYHATVHFNWDGGRIQGSAPITTILHVVDGKIVEHRDYFDYHTATARKD